MSKACILVLVLITSTSLYAGVPLEGNFELAGPVSNQGTVTPGKSHLYLNINSKAAKKLYEAFDGTPEKDECTGYLFKGQGSVGCYEVEKGEKYYCNFSINLEKGIVEAGAGGC